MATTTTTTTTTTTEPPPTVRRRPVRPMRPLRRPINRRPIDDYYYDEYYQEDYYQEPLSRRRLPSRMRPKKPLIDYDEEYDREPLHPEEIEKPRRHPNNRNRFRDDVDELEEDYDSVRPHSKGVERRKPGGRVPIGVNSAGRLAGDERRSFADDRPLERPLRKEKPRVIPEEDEEEEAVEPALNARRYAGRRRVNEKRLGADNAHAADQEAEEVKDDKQRTSPRPLEEFITPKAVGQSVYARPRVPPRIARPVPINEKNKYQYPIQKTATTAAPSSTPTPDEPEEEYYADEDYVYSAGRGQQRRRRIQEPIDTNEERLVGRKRYRNDAPLSRQKPLRARNQLRKPASDKKHAAPAAYEDYEVAEEEAAEPVHTAPLSSARRPSPFVGRRRSSAAPAAAADDVDFEDVDYYAPVGKPKNKPKASSVAQRGQREGDSRKKTLGLAGKNRRPPVNDDVDVAASVEDEPVHVVRKPVHKASLAARQEVETAPVDSQDENEDADAVAEDAEVPAGKKGNSAPRLYSPVRVVKRPFLPSRGGSPYLPRGLQAVGVAPKLLSLGQQPRDSVDVDVGPTISSIRMLEHSALVLRHSELMAGGQLAQAQTATTLPPRRQLPLSMPKVQQAQVETHSEEQVDEEPEELAEEDQLDLTGHQQQEQEQQEESQEPQQQNVVAQSPQATLDMLYENDYDVTINDALNPTLKPLSPQLPSKHDHRNYASRAYASASANIDSSSSLLSSPSSSSASSSLSSTSSQSLSANTKQANSSNIKSSPSVAASSSSAGAAAPTSSNHIVKNNHLLYGQQQQKQQQLQQRPYNNNHYNSDSHFSSTDLRRRTIFQTSPETASHGYTSQRAANTFVGVASHARRIQPPPVYADEYDY